MKRYLVAGLLAVGALALSADTASAQCQSVHGKFCGGFNFVLPRVKFCFDSCPPGPCYPAPAAPCGDGGPIVAPPAHAWYNYWPHGGHGPAPVAGGRVPVQPIPAPRMQMQGPQAASYQPMNPAASAGSYATSATGAAPYYWYGR